MTVTIADCAAQVRTGLYNAAVTAINDAKVQILRGLPGTNQRDDIVSIGSPAGQFINPETGVATLSATGRTRYLQLTTPVTFSVFRRGGPETEEAVTDRAFDLFSVVEKQVRVGDITLGGACMWCLCTQWPDPTPVSVVMPNKAKGRLAEFPATFVALCRLTNL
jgi:hypothetical protein